MRIHDLKKKNSLTDSFSVNQKHEKKSMNECHDKTQHKE